MIYIHGFNSGPNTSTAKLLGPNTKCASYKSDKSFFENFESLKKQINSEEILVGTSLGGFYAAMLGIKSILVNPCTFPEKVLVPGYYSNYNNVLEKKFYLSQEVINTYKGTIFPAGVPRLIIIGLNDTLIDPQENIDFWSKRGRVITGNFGHRIKSFEPFKDEMEKFKWYEIF